MRTLKTIGASIWSRIVALAKALNAALTPPPLLDSERLERPLDDTVFQRREF